MKLTTSQLQTILLAILVLAVISLAYRTRSQAIMLAELDAVAVIHTARIDTLEARQNTFLLPLVRMHFIPPQAPRPNNPYNRSDM